MTLYNKRPAIIIHDFFMVVIAWQVAWWIRFNFDVPEYYWHISLYTLPILLLAQGFVFHRFKLYLGLWRFASLPDLWNIFRAAIVGALSITLIFFIWFRLEGIPRSVLVLYPVFLMFLLGGPRLSYRMWKDHSFNIKKITNGKRVLIVGAGRAGEMLAREILRERNYLPIGFIDDNEKLLNSEIHGIKVLGLVDDIPTISQQQHVDIIIIAVPSASTEEMQRIVKMSEQSGCALRTLPKIQDMVSGKVTLRQLREVSIEDLLGREKVELDWKIIQEGITNKTVLVTGGGGSIGRELCKQIAKLNPSALIIFERSEFNLYAIEKEIKDLNLSVDIHSVLGDLLDSLKVERILNEYNPDIIFHAAAYKHVPILQNQVREAVRNNIIATHHFAESAIKYNCKKFIYISTDKAVNPVNVLGITKRFSEMYCELKNRQSNTKFITVRFGNVLGSDGSVVPLFKEQIKNGGPVTVTHPEISRYFMTIPEACQLIMQSAAMGNGGEIFVLDMGKSVKITYLAEQMIRLSGLEPAVDINIIYSGLRPGEKLYEELFYENEAIEKTSHSKIMLAMHSNIDGDFIAEYMYELQSACNEFNEDKLKDLLNELITSTSPVKEDHDKVIPINSGRR